MTITNKVRVKIKIKGTVCTCKTENGTVYTCKTKNGTVCTFKTKKMGLCIPVKRKNRTVYWFKIKIKLDVCPVKN